MGRDNKKTGSFCYLLNASWNGGKLSTRGAGRGSVACMGKSLCYIPFAFESNEYLFKNQ